MKRTRLITVIGIIVLFLNTCNTAVMDTDAENNTEGNSGNKEDKIITIKETGPLDDRAWDRILNRIAAQDALVNLDLSECTVSPANQEGHGGLVRRNQVFNGPPHVTRSRVFFDPLYEESRGKDKIVSLTLPDRAEMIGLGWSAAHAFQNSNGYGMRSPTPGTLEYGDFIYWTITNPAFKHFTRLRSVTGRGILQIGHYAFSGLKSLEQVNFPKVGHIVREIELATSWAIFVDSAPPPNSEGISEYPSAKPVDGYEEKDICYAAFMNCTALREVNIPDVRFISIGAFMNCTSLRELKFQYVWILQQNAFEGCTGLTRVELPHATKIGDYAFRDCTRLAEVKFGATTYDPGGLQLPYSPCGNIGDGMGSSSPSPQDKAFKSSIHISDGAFYGCKALRKVEIPYAWNVKFGTCAFGNIGTTLDIYLSNGGHSLTDVLSFGKDNYVGNNIYQNTSITLKTINFYGLNQTNFDIIRFGKEKRGIPPTHKTYNFWGSEKYPDYTEQDEGLEKVPKRPYDDADVPRITLVRRQ
jgi:hypothetical protein